MNLCFKNGERVSVRFRRLPRTWEGEVIRDDGKSTILILSDYFNVTNVERNRVSLIK